jgi:hypothetical protein
VIEDVLEGTIGRVEALEEKMAGTVPEEEMTRRPFSPQNMEQAYIRSQEDTILRVIFDDIDKLKKGQAETTARAEHRLDTIEKALTYAQFPVEPDIIQLDVNALKGDVTNIKEQAKKFASQASLDFWEQHFHTQFRETDSDIRYIKQDIKRVSDKVAALDMKQAALLPIWALFLMLVLGLGSGIAIGLGIALGMN